MTLLRSVWGDLVDKRLWPLAALLVVALVALPIVLGRGGGDPAPAAAPAAAAPPADVVALHAGPATSRPRARARDPFAQRKRTAGAPAAIASAPAPAPAPSAAATVNPPAAGATAPGASRSSPAAAPQLPSAVRTPAAPAPARPPAASAPSARPAAGYRVDVRFGRAAATKGRHDLTRLAVLRAGEAPVLLYLGVRKGGRVAVFQLAGEGIAATGDGRCLPSRGPCETIELRDGDVQYLDVPTAAGIVQYELELTKVARKHAATAARAARSRRRESKAGRRVLRAVIAAGHLYVGRYEYSKRRGVLVAHPPRTRRPAAP
jgi:hypothetical protein